MNRIEIRRIVMQRRLFGPAPREAAVIGMGTWYFEQADRRTAIASLQRGLDLGMNHIDTAEMYGSGVAEQIIGEAIAGRRDEVYLISKVLPYNASRSGTRLACERSLARLRTDRLDCYLLHWRGPHPLAETIAAFEELREDGKILNWGVSNFDTSDLDEVLAVVGEGRLVCNQVLYHLLERTIESSVIPWCEQHGVAVVAYSPFGHSRFPGAQTPGGRILAEIAAAHDATPRQVALAFLVRRPSVFAIPKAAIPEHVEENAAAGDLRLAPEELSRIDDAFPRDPHRGKLPIL
jgi:diketogulonate reductase-like aldo/keto reductase